jgi:murein DD-endopeptidase MepM/ murein hydrolase activator NlpD
VIRREAAFALALALLPALAGAGGTSSIDARIQAQRAKAAQMQSRLASKKAELHSVTLHYNDLQNQLHETNVAIDGVNARIGGLQADQNSTQRRIDWNTVQLAAAQKSMHLHDTMLKRRLVDIYEYGDISYVNALIAARSFSEFVERWEDLRRLVGANQEALRERKAAEAHVAAVEADLDSTRLELQQQEEEQQQARDQLGSLAAERSNLVQLASVERNHVAAEVADMEGLTEAQEAELEALIREREQEIEAERRASGIAGGIESPGGPGSFSWPVTGTITSPFGWRSNPFGGGPEFHQGLDIAAPMGTTVTAAAGGTVIMAQWYGGYGNYILIDNGGGYSTGYGHLSAIYVSTGQAVQRGQAIGAVGSTGQSTGPHLHFEIRIAGKPVDPAPRLH